MKNEVNETMEALRTTKTHDILGAENQADDRYQLVRVDDALQIQQPTISQLISRSKNSSGTKGKSAKKAGDSRKAAKTPAGKKKVKMDKFGKETGLLSKKLVIQDGKLVMEDEDTSMSKLEGEKIKTGQERLTSSSFSKRNFSEKWTEEETKKFYKALEIFGSDFSMIAPLFPTRNRNQIKNKFRREERESSHRVDKAMKKHRGKKFFPKQVVGLMSTTTNADGEIEDIELVAGPRGRRLDSNASVDSMDLRIADDLSNMLNDAIAGSQAAKKEMMKFQQLNSAHEIKNMNRMAAEHLSLSDVNTVVASPDLQATNSEKSI